MTPKEFAKKIIASINPGTADISGIGDGTIKGAISEQNKNMNEKGVYPLITTEQGGTITIPDITQYDLLIFYMDIDSADTSIGATQQFTLVVSHVINRYGKIYFTGKGGNGDTSGYIIFNSATSFTVLRTGEVTSVATVNAVYGVKL